MNPGRLFARVGGSRGQYADGDAGLVAKFAVFDCSPRFACIVVKADRLEDRHLPAPRPPKAGSPRRSATRPAATIAPCFYQRVPRLLADLGLARGDGRYPRLLRALGRVDLLILDDWGLEPLDAAVRHDLLEISSKIAAAAAPPSSPASSPSTNGTR